MNERWRGRWKTGLPILVVVILGVALLTGRLSPRTQVLTTTRMLMGTLVSISTWGVPPARSDRAVNRAFAEMARIEDVMSSHRPTTEVSRINQVSRETWIPLSDALGQLLQQGLVLTERSNQAFAMGLEPLTGLWGFSSDRAVSAPPPSSAWQAWLQAYPATGAIELRELPDHTRQIRLKSASVGLDLGGIAKGYAVDQAIAVLRQEGVDNAIVDAGGDLRVIGSKGGEPWRIGLQHPRQTDQVAAVSLLQGDMAMMTSGDYERFFLHEGQRYHHIMDPGTGTPAQSGLSSVSVQGVGGSIAHGLSTAIFVLGAERGLALLKQFPGSEALLITTEGQPIQTPGFVGTWLAKP
ncbi:MAG: FAD:protein FMN transferase [Magnetococcus sp. DMHC-8]